MTSLDNLRGIVSLARLGRDRQRVLVEWNRTAVDFPAGKCLHHFLTDQARTRPGAIAAIHHGQPLTYAELDRRSNRLAHHLQAHGAGPDVPVAIFLERSLAMVVGLYGILKAGSCYVPLDPDYPTARLQFMLADVGAPLLLTQASLAGALPAGDVTTVLIDQAWPAIAQHPAGAPPATTVTPDHLAYVIYTSGSTGQPKGTMLNHRGRVNNFADFNRRYAIGPDDAVLGISSLSFDMSAYDTFGTVMAGGTLVIVDGADTLAPERWATLMRDHDVTVWHSVPALLGMLVDHIEPRPGAIPHALRLALLGGDWIPVRLPDRLKTLIPSVHCVSMGGATECSMDSTIYDIDEPSSGWKSIPYGKPMANQTCYVLEENLNPVGLGEEGELYLGGVGVGRGYFTRPGLTAAKFLPNPFSGVPGDRMYRTGDLVRYYPDGNLELLGRIDFMVKIRGNRVEIGEIEAAIRRHPGVKECLVLLRNDPGTDKRLVAYLLQDPHYTGDDHLQTSQVDEWQQVYETAYQRPAPGDDPTFNIVSWDSSYTNQPIPAAEMREWVENTVRRILASRPGRVLEIGCGTGLLLFRIAPHTQRYVGTDFSPAAIEYVGQHLADQGLAGIVELYEQAADEFDRFDDNAFDAVVLNSIVMDFPSLDYLLAAIEGAVRVVAPGGVIFIGDVRGLPLLETFHTSVQVHRSPAGQSIAALRRHIARRVRDEEELVIDPAFFVSLPERIPGIGAAQLHVKEGRAQNEMIRYRYDVALSVGAPGMGVLAADVAWHDWSESGWSLARLGERLATGDEPVLRLARIPNDRLVGDVALQRQVQDWDEAATVAELRAAVGDVTGIAPDDLWATGRAHGYRVLLQPSPDVGFMDAIFVHDDSGDRSPLRTANRWPTGDDVPLAELSNNPLQAKVARRLIPDLRRTLHDRLPDYMVPSAFVLMDAFPLNPNGKINRRAFPRPGTARPALAAPYVAPRTPVEHLLADLWQELLGLDEVGVLDPFVLLGGHSLLATQMVSRLRDIFRVELPLSYGFNATIAGLAEQLVAAGAAQDIDVRHIARTTTTTTAHQTIPRRDPDATIPASILQEGMWVTEAMNPDTATYNVPMVSRLRGKLDVAALEGALNEIVRRHEALRTTFRQEDGQLVQHIAPYKPADLDVIDLAGDPAGETTALDLATQSARQPFDLAAGPLYRWFLARLGDDDHVFVATLHHIITDGWSMGVFTRELTAIYEALLHARPVPLADLPIQFADYARWQRDRLQGDALDRFQGYWQEQLAGSDFILDLPTDYPRPAVQSGRGNHVGIDIPAPLTTQLRALGREHNTTLFVTLLATFKVLLAAFAGQDDVIVGTPIANRTHSELEGLIGYFVNLLPLRTDLTTTPTVADLLRHVNAVTVGANAHQELPFGKIVELMRPPRDPGRNPIFQVELTLLTPENAPPVYGYGFRSPVDQTLFLGPVQMEPLSVESGVSKFDLTILLWDMPDRVSGTVEYSADLFTAETITALANAYRELLDLVVADPSRPVADLRAAFADRWQTYSRQKQAHRKQSAAGRLQSIRRKRSR